MGCVGQAGCDPQKPALVTRGGSRVGGDVCPGIAWRPLSPVVSGSQEPSTFIAASFSRSVTFHCVSGASSESTQLCCWGHLAFLLTVNHPVRYRCAHGDLTSLADNRGQWPPRCPRTHIPAHPGSAPGHQGWLLGIAASLGTCLLTGMRLRRAPRGTPACRGTFGGPRKAVRDRFALQGGTEDFS